MGWILEVGMDGKPTDTYEKELAKLQTALRSDGVKNLLVHIHGGLVDQPTGTEVSKRFIQFFETPETLVVAFLWPTGIADVFRSFFSFPGSAGLFQTLYGKVTAANSPDRITEKEADRLIQGVFPRSLLDSWQGTIVSRSRKAGILVPFLSDSERVFVNKLLKALIAVWKKFGMNGQIPRDLSQSALEKTLAALPIIHCAVRKMWKKMNDVADNSVKASGGAEKLWSVLADLRPKVQVTFVAASAGARLLSRLLVANCGTSPSFRPHLVFLAPAISMEEWDKALSKVSSRLKSSTLFTMDDTREASDPLFWGWDPDSRDKNALRFAYPSSLLYLISRQLDTSNSKNPVPLVGLQWYHSRTDRFPQVANWLKKTTIALSGIAPTNLPIRADACCHGDFDDDKVRHCSNPEAHDHLCKTSAEWESIRNLLE